MSMAIAQLQLRRRLLEDYNEVWGLWGFEGNPCFNNNYGGFEGFKDKYLTFSCIYYWFCTLNSWRILNTTYLYFSIHFLIYFYRFCQCKSTALNLFSCFTGLLYMHVPTGTLENIIIYYFIPNSITKIYIGKTKILVLYG